MNFRQAFSMAAVTIAAVTMFGRAGTQETKIERLDAALDAVIAPGATLEKVAGGYTWTEGPVWLKNGGYLLFADIPANAIWKFTPVAGRRCSCIQAGGRRRLRSAARSRGRME